MEFQALQAGHWPIHFEDSYPHSLQKNAVVFALAIGLSFLSIPCISCFPNMQQTAKRAAFMAAP